MRNAALITGVILLFLIAFGGIFYNVDETEQVIITQFGKPVGAPITEAGLHTKLPFIQKAQFFPKTLLEWNGEPGTDSHSGQDLYLCRDLCPLAHQGPAQIL